MKQKIISLRMLALAVAACATLFLSGCVSMPTYAKSFPDEPIASPENSSIYFGAYFENAFFTEIDFAQMNTDMPPCDLKPMLYGAIWVTKPVKTGERYKLFHAWGYKVIYIPRLDSKSKLDFTVSSKPGLHYMGYRGNLEELYNKDQVKMEWQTLSVVQQMYAGTAWEPVIQKRIEELKNAK